MRKKCAVKNCPNNSKSKPKLSYFLFPTDEELANKWIQFCASDREINIRNSYICSQHFKIEDIENNLKFEMGYCSKRTLKSDAVPTTCNEDEQRQEYKKIVDDLLQEYEQTLNGTASSVGFNKFNINATYNTTFQRENNLQTIKLINEAQFDNEESSTQQSTFVSDADNAAAPFSPLIEIKSEDDDEPEDDVDTTFPFISKCTQTDEAAEDRINCGFVNVTKSGRDKFFNLRCFYCDAEYPITFWAEFSDHILYNHASLEKAYAKKDDLKSTTISEKNICDEMEWEEAYEKKDDLKSTTISKNNICDKMDVTDSASEGGGEEDELPINFINIENIGKKEKTKITKIKNIKQDLELINILSRALDSSDTEEEYVSTVGPANRKDSAKDCNSRSTPKTPRGVVMRLHQKQQQQNMCVKKYVPNLDHSYSQYDLNESLEEIMFNDAIPIDEICFAKTPHKIVIDLLDHLKGFPSLWHDRNIDYEKYDNDLQELLNIMQLKWSLNIRMDYLRKNVENIKAWFYSIKAEENIVTMDNMHNQDMFDEYYINCSEFLNIGIDIKYNIPCDLCNRTFSNLLLLLTHKHRRHKIGDRPYKCSKCVRRFAHLHSVLNHVNGHVRRQLNKKQKTIIVKPPPPKDLACFECKEKFSSEHEYKNHLDIHPKGDCPYACEECGKRYRTTILKNKHQQLHNLQNMDYQCELCPSKLSSAYSYKCHMNGHKGIYECICEHCGQGFVSKKYLLEHRKYSHLGHGICKICNREYKKRRILQKHLRDRHKVTFGTNEHLSKRRVVLSRISRRGGSMKGKRGGNLKLRKYEHIIDPVTNTTRVKCPKCDKSYRQNKNLLLHAAKIHNFDARTILRNYQKLKQLESLESSNLNNNDTLNEQRNTQVDLAVNAITECSEAKLELSDDYNIIEVVEENEEEKYANEILFTANDNLHLHSSNDLLVMDGDGQVKGESPFTKVEVLECGSYEFILSND